MDGMCTWDAWSLQEIIRPDTDAGSSSTDGFSILHNIGRGGHSVVIGSRYRGTHAAGVAIHRRWAPCIAEVHESPRVLSVMLKTMDADTNTVRNIQVISAHLPSLLGHTADEIDQTIRHFAEKVRGQRRNEIFVGMDANFTLSERQVSAGVVGTAIPQQQAPSVAMREVLTEFVQQLALLNLCAVNTFEGWWKKLDSQPPSRHTWRGKMYGRPKEACLDLLLMDKNSAAAITKTYINSDVAFRSDHSLCLSQVRLPARLQVRPRAPRKPHIGWTPQDPQSTAPTLPRR